MFKSVTANLALVVLAALMSFLTGWLCLAAFASGNPALRLAVGPLAALGWFVWLGWLGVHVTDLLDALFPRK